MRSSSNHLDACVGVGGGAAIALFFACHSHITKPGTQIANRTQIGSTPVELASTRIQYESGAKAVSVIQPISSAAAARGSGHNRYQG